MVELANHLDGSQFDVHVCALSDHVPLAGALTDAEHRLHIVRKRNRFDFTVVLRLARLLRTLKADIVHGYLFSAEIASRLAGHLVNTTLVIGSERNADYSIPKGQVFLYRLTQGFADAVVANSKAGAEWNRKVFHRPASDYWAVHNGVDAERFHPRDGSVMRETLGIPSGCPVVGAFANFKRQKNHAMLFRAFRRVVDAFPDARLLLVGDQPVDSRGRLNAYVQQLQNQIDDLHIRHNCMLLGHRKDTEHIYPACEITVLSSLHEGTPNVLLESMSCGVPVVATNVCDNSYIVRENEVGYLVRVGDEAGMAERARSLLGNTALRQEMGQRARHWVLTEFSTKRLAEKMGAVYLELLSRKNGHDCPTDVKQ